MTIRTKILTISILFCLVVVALILPNHYLLRRTRDLNLLTLHVHQEHIAVQNLLILVGRELKEVSDEIFLADHDTQVVRLDDQIKAAFTQLDDYSQSRRFDPGQVHDVGHLSSEEIMTGALKLSYGKMKDAKAEIQRLYETGRIEPARRLMEQTYEREFDHNFRAIASEWLREEAAELEECTSGFNNFFGNFLHLTRTLGLISIVLALLFSFLLYRFVSRRLLTLLHGVENVAGGDLNSKLELSGRDELTKVAAAFNDMIDKLAVSRTHLLEQCYLAGINEASSDILHNIKNSFTQLLYTSEKLQPLVEQLKQAAGGADGPAASSTALAALTVLADKLQVSISDVHQILKTTQQDFVADQGLQNCRLRELINDSLNLLSREYLERIRIYIDPGVNRVGAIHTHRIVLIQILSNLITNACEAIIRQDEPNGMVSISAAIDREEGGACVHLFVRDNGCGVAAQNLEQIFRRHFSSKLRLRHGLTGLGLNWCRNAAVSLNGRLFAESAGVGQGTTMHLLLAVGNHGASPGAPPP